MSGKNSRIVFDGHCDTPSRIGAGSFQLEKRNGSGHIDIPRMREGGVSAQFFACCVDPDLPPGVWEETARHCLDSTVRAIEPLEGIKLALSGSEIKKALERELISIMLSVEGGHVITSPASLEYFYGLGMRSLAVTWKNSNRLADSSEGSRRWGGISPFGGEMVSEMNRLGVLIDCSHASRESFFDILEHSSDPVILSHSCAAGICDIPRNADDSQMKALAESGGVICINFFPAFLDQKANREIMKIWKPYREKKSALARRYGNDPERAGAELLPDAMRRLEKIPMPGVSSVADHIVYAVEIAGIDHVGLGSDFDGIPVTPSGLEDISRVPALERELAGRGFSQRDRDRIMGENLLRVVELVCG
ncbi:MAG: membrane dipeptidase [Candidatus Latescibacteria bacterium]|nr:membrane dipeptidase [bacterium]MBD3423816.1 membrane dipeptidase [Candidatus Latescibacterota bacterium]